MTNSKAGKTQFRIDNEIGAVIKPHGDRLTFALAFPNTYSLGMSSLGFQTIYRIINDRSDSVCERVFLPDDNCAANEPLLTIESLKPLTDFDIAAFSLSFEMDYHNALRMMISSKIEPYSNKRIDNENNPIIIAGGIAVTFNPEPLADFIDLFVIGEGEEAVNEITECIVHHKDLNKADLLKKLALIDGVYVPRYYNPLYKVDGTIDRIDADEKAPKLINRRWVKNIGEHPASTLITTPDTQFSNMILVEIARGCGRQCRFCAAGFACLPSRPSNPKAVMDAIMAHDHTKHRVGLMSASVFDHAASLDICRQLINEGCMFSISSTRADTLNEETAELLIKGGHKTLTIAPEAGTDRLRNVINKVISHTEIINAAESAWKCGFKHIKLYFMIGLPTETDEDIQGITDLAGEIADLHKWQKVDVSVSCFVPKPSTPFQWVSMESQKELKDKLNKLKSSFFQIKNIRFNSESPRESIIQGVIARGDRRVGKALLKYAESNISWSAAFRETGINPSFYTERLRSLDEVFPWAHIHLGVNKDYLINEYQKALKGKTTEGCSADLCHNCGVCFPNNN